MLEKLKTQGVKMRVFFLPLWLLDIWLAEKVQNWAVCCNWWCSVRHCSCWRATSSWKQFSSVFSKTNDDKRYHLYKLPSSNHSLQEPLVNQLVSVGRGCECRGGLVFTGICSPLLTVRSQALLKIQMITKFQGLPSFPLTSWPSETSRKNQKYSIMEAIKTAWVPGSGSVLG